MSRIGKQPISVPENVNVDIKGTIIFAKGPLGEDSVEILDGYKINLEDKILTISITETNDNPKASAFQGLFRSLINNLIEGVSKGFEKELEIIGVGYRAIQQGANIQFQLGFSHAIDFKAPAGIKLEVIEATKVKIKGFNKQQVGQVAANIRKLRPPEPYKGKGVRYKNEHVRKKAGKTGK